jgi:hypothetical protein
MYHKVLALSIVVVGLICGGIALIYSQNTKTMSAGAIKENRNEIIVVLQPSSGVSVKMGSFSSRESNRVDNINRLLKEYGSEVRKIEIPIPKESPPATEYYQIFHSGDPTRLLEALKAEDWVESAYLKPKSEDPGGF